MSPAPLQQPSAPQAAHFPHCCRASLTPAQFSVPPCLMLPSTCLPRGAPKACGVAVRGSDEGPAAVGEATDAAGEASEEIRAATVAGDSAE
mmetsp:Transcript_43528/g.98386  ORF Transcript_43528/g.98386 Transcript_43528/m.98386 type:complete len:91 (-) Transcript_43528:423-695(-)